VRSCNRLQPLTEFSGTKRTCERALQAHNARRRQRYQAHRGASAPASAPSAAAAAASSDAADGSSSLPPGAPSPPHLLPLPPPFSTGLFADVAGDTWLDVDGIVDDFFSTFPNLDDAPHAHAHAAAPPPLAPPLPPALGYALYGALDGGGGGGGGGGAAAWPDAAPPPLFPPPPWPLLPLLPALGPPAAVGGPMAPHPWDAASLAACYAAPHVRPASLSLKLLSDAPTHFPLGGLRPAALRAFGAATSAPSAPSGRAPLALEGSITPGCTLLHCDAVLCCADADADADADVCARDALSAMLAESGEAGAFLRAPGRALRVTDSAGRVASACGGVVADADADAEDADADAAQQQEQLPPLSPLAVLCTHLAPLAFTRPLPPTLRRCALRATLHGQHLHIDDASSPSSSSQDVPMLGVLPPCGVEGAALLHAVHTASGERRGGINACVVLLTSSAEIVAEVAATEALLLEAERIGTTAEGDVTATSAMRARLQSALLALGHALRPGCAPPLAARAAAACVSLGWRAAATRVLHAHAACSARSLLLPRRVSLLHVAAASGQAWAVRAVLHAGGAAFVFGAPHSVCATRARATPAQLAAAHARSGSGGAAAALAERCGGTALLPRLPFVAAASGTSDDARAAAAAAAAFRQAAARGDAQPLADAAACSAAVIAPPLPPHHKTLSPPLRMPLLLDAAAPSSSAAAAAAARAVLRLCSLVAAHTLTTTQYKQRQLHTRDTVLLPMPRANTLCALLLARAALTHVGQWCACWPLAAPLDGHTGWWATQAALRDVVTAAACVALVARERRDKARWRGAASTAAAREKCA
jgi:hypothetical protein